MNEQKSEGSHLFHNKGYLDETAGRALRDRSAKSARGHSVAPAMWSCITGCTRVQYNIDVVKRPTKLQVTDAV